MRVSTMLLVLPLVVAGGCDEEPAGKAPAAAASYQEYGDGVPEGAELVPIPTLVKDPGPWDGKSVTVKGIVVSVCPTAGCFLFLGEGSSQIEVDLMEKGFTIPPGGRWAGHVAFATGVVQVSGGQVKLAGHGLLMVERPR